MALIKKSAVMNPLTHCWLCCQ